MFLFAMQNPQEPWFLRGQLLPLPLPTLLDDDELAPWTAHRFVLCDAPPVRYDAVPILEDDGGLVISNVAFRPDGTLVPNACETALAIWEDDWPLKPRAAATRQEGVVPARALGDLPE